MTVSRRTFLKTAGAATTFGVATSGLFPAATNNAWAQSSLSIGTSKIDVLSDGHLQLPVSMLMADVDPKQMKTLFEKHQLSMTAHQPSCNLTLVRDEDRVILFDAGSGTNFMPTAGKISEALDAIEVDPSEVTHVVFTHAHPDHLWGLLDDFDDPMFSEAEYMISNKEWDYWINPQTVDDIGEARQIFAVGAKRNLEAIEDRMTRFEFESEILPGIRAINTAGHTPGHASFEVRSGSESVVVVGDVLSNPYYSFEAPQWPIGSDQDQELAITARKNLLDQLASDKMQMIGYHIPFPGIGRVERDGNAYRFVAA